MGGSALEERFRKIIEQFTFEGQWFEVVPYGFGHINETFAVTCKQKNGTNRRYILQRINHNVFKQPAAVMDNMTLITAHLKDKILEAGGDPRRETINLIPTHSGQNYYQNELGETWRAEIFIENAQTYSIPKHPAHYYHAAQAFGRFGARLDDFPVQRLQTTIPDFHHTPKRFAAFLQAIQRDAVGRAQTVRSEIDFILERQRDVSILVDLCAAGHMRERVTHNDTKFENVMIDDQTNTGICVIDLDTVMPGMIVFDFGDAVRSGSCTAAEDEVNLERVHFDLGIFDHLARGYLDSIGRILTDIEINHLAFGARLITLEQAMRFLADYINGDTYYKIHRPEHNLERARTQIKMVREMEDQAGAMQQIIRGYCPG